MGRKLKHPYFPKKRNPLWMVTHPASIGTIAAAVSASVPYGNLQGLTSTILEKLPGGEHIPVRVPLVLVGFLCGYGSVKGWHYFRMKVIKSLLSYFGWMTAPKSTKSKLWALALKFFCGPQPYSTFMYQPCLPKQPLPDLDQTLDRWLEVAEHLVSEGEFEQTRELVEEFRRNEGPRLQKYLEDKANAEDNYVYHYWINAAYLGSRQPLPVHSNYYVGSMLSEARQTDQLTRAAAQARAYAEMQRMIENNTVPPVLLQELVPLCMNGYKCIFNSVRVPGLVLDSLEKHPGKSHIIVIRNRQYFKVDLHYPDSKGSLLTAQEIYEQLKYIVADSDASTAKELPVAALTGQKRHVWAKQRLELMSRNKEVLNDVESAMFILLLDDFVPKNYSEMAHRYLTGSLDNIWFDKSFSFMVLGNAMAAGHVEHTAIDAMVFTNASEYTLFRENYENRQLPKGSPLRKLTQPQRLQWDTRGMESEINNAYSELKQLVDDTDMYVLNAPYSKGFIKKQRISPDGYIQMALQLAYYKLYKETAKTYEPSTGRLFLLGRTETVNPISSSSKTWVQAMIDPNSSREQKLGLLKKAVNYQTNYRLEATVGKACDRHLFALMCASRDLGMDFPKFFMDKSWQLSYKLSTSQTPCYLFEYGLDLNYDAGCGGFGPGCPDGYGICYILFGDDVLNIHIASWKSCSTTSSVKMGNAIVEAMEEMKALCQ